MSLYVNIKKDFGSFQLNSKFTLERGVLGFLGSSGSGKSVTLRCIAGIETPDEGKIILNGVPLFDHEKKINLPPQKRKIGYLFQDYALFPNMNVEKNILSGLHWQKDKEERKRQCKEIIERMHLSGLERHFPAQLSGGQKQRVAMARILVNKPDLLLLDEPFSALDSFLKDQLEVEIKTLLKEYGKEVIFVSHSRDEIYHLCDEVAILDKGHVENKKGVRQLFAAPDTVEGAILTGCKNIVKAIKTGEHQVYVEDWNVFFETKDIVRDDLVAIGIRAHYFQPKIKANVEDVILMEEMEEPFEWTLKFQYKKAKKEATPIWWRLPKEKKLREFPEQLGIAPQNIMLLGKGEQR